MTRQIIRIPRPADADARLDAFHLWTDAPARTGRLRIALGLAGGAVFAVAVALGVGGWW